MFLLRKSAEDFISSLVAVTTTVECIAGERFLFDVIRIERIQFTRRIANYSGRVKSRRKNHSATFEIYRVS